MDEVVAHEPHSKPARNQVRFAESGGPSAFSHDAVLRSNRQTQSPILGPALWRQWQRPSRDRTDEQPRPGRRRRSGALHMFHVGHLNILLRARERCDRLVVGVVTDDALFEARAASGWSRWRSGWRLCGIWRWSTTWWSIRNKSRCGSGSFDVLFKVTRRRGTEKETDSRPTRPIVGVQVVYFPYTVHNASTSLACSPPTQPRRTFGRAGAPTGPEFGSCQSEDVSGSVRRREEEDRAVTAV